MATEIERKFLTTSLAWHSGSARVKIRQGYILATPTQSVRVRTKDDLGFITIKAKKHEGVTNEYEYEIPADDANELLDVVCQKPLIEKFRYTKEELGHTWEIDEFLGGNKGLVVAEVELSDTNEPVELPDWIGEEVTGDPRYLNANLYQHPYSEWKT
jgi:CYTH domain-containing protein